MSGRVVVVGGGIAGLAAANRLLHPDPAQSPALARLQVTIIEAEPRFGGKIRTDCSDGFVIDAGPDSFLASRPAALMLAAELGLSNTLIGTRPSARQAFVRRGRLHAMPAGMTGLVPVRASAWLGAGMLSWPGRLRALLDLLLPNRAPSTDESIAAFTRRRFGKEACDWLLEPLLAGIHGGHGESLSLAATFPALSEAERRSGSVMRGLSRLARPAAERSAESRGTFVTPRHGMQQLTDAMQQRLASACELRAATRVLRIDRNGDEWRVHTDRESFEADALVLAAPANHASLIVRAAAPRLAGLLAAIPFAASTVVHVAFDAGAAPRPLEGSGYLNPRPAGRQVAACTWSSNKFEGRAPGSALLLRAFLKGEAATLADDEAVRIACDEIAGTTGITAAPRWHRVYRYPDGMPQYTVGHLDRLAAIDLELRGLPGLFLAGHSYRGIGIPDTIRSADTAAAGVRLHLDRTRTHAY